MTTKRLVLAVESLGFALAVVLAFVAFHTDPPARDLIVGVASSFLFAALTLWLGAGYRRVSHLQFRRFFGDEMVQEGATLAHPAFDLSIRAKDILAAHGDREETYYAKPESPFVSALRQIDLPRVVAANDMEALVYISGLLQQHGSTRGVDVMVDHVVAQRSNRSFVSVGLSSSDCTHMYLATADRPLFEIRGQPGDQSIALSEWAKPVATVGSEPERASWASTPERQVGLIVRHAPDPHERPDRRWFLVAGVGPTATIGAAWFLAQCWKRLHRNCGKGNFVAVISISPAAPREVRLEAIRVDCVGTDGHGEGGLAPTQGQA